MSTVYFTDCLTRLSASLSYICEILVFSSQWGFLWPFHMFIIDVYYSIEVSLPRYIRKTWRHQVMRIWSMAKPATHRLRYVSSGWQIIEWPRVIVLDDEISLVFMGWEWILFDFSIRLLSLLAVLCWVDILVLFQFLWFRTFIFHRLTSSRCKPPRKDGSFGWLDRQESFFYSILVGYPFSSWSLILKIGQSFVY